MEGRKNRSGRQELTRSAIESSNHLGNFLKFVQKRTLPLVEDVDIDVFDSCVCQRLLRSGSSASPWFTASRCRDGSLAVIQPLRVQQTAEESSSYGRVHPHFAGNVHASVRVSGIEKERSCPTACATSPMLVGRDRSFRKVVFTKTGVRDGLVLRDQRWFQWVNKLLPWLTW